MSESIDLERVGSRDDDQHEDEKNNSNNLIYDIDTAPPWYLSIVLGFQVQ